MKTHNFFIEEIYFQGKIADLCSNLHKSYRFMNRFENLSDLFKLKIRYLCKLLQIYAEKKNPV